MWFKLAGADFSKNNLGTMSSISSSYLIDYTGLTGMSGSPSSVSYAGSDAGTSKSVTVTVTITSGYTFKNGSTISASGGKTGTVFTAQQDYTGGNTFTFNMDVNANTKLTGVAEATGGSSSGGNTGGSEGNEPETPVNPPSGGTTTLTLHKSATGNSILDYQDVWKMFKASSLATLGSQIIGVDVSAYAGQEISITAAQSVIAGASYAMFCSNLPNAYIKSLAELDGYNSFGTATNYIAESYDNLIESFNISIVKETTNTVNKVVPANAKYLFFSNLSVKCANPSVVVGNTAGASLVSYTTEDGWCCMDYQTYFYLTANSTFQGYQSKVIAVDVSELVGKTLSITATHSVVDGAYYAFFTNKLPTGINSIEQIEGLAYSASGKYNFADKASDLVGESFNVSTEHQVANTITKVVPTGAKYLFVNTLNKFGSSEIKLV